MNKKEVIQRLRDHLRSLHFKINEPEVYIPTWHYNWCVTYVMDFLLVDKEVAKKIIEEEVLAGSKLVSKPIQKDDKQASEYVTPRDYSNYTGIPRNTIMRAIYTGRLMAYKDSNNHWAIPKDEANRFAAKYKK